ncbi:hypothetical protein [Arthrobacter sp. 2MCAF14]|uniref:hypothetical protein n=1 Tax=Arthrobacter sp. 2MCAF14 TaxID=3232982 RepID=UPI003F91B516
MTKTTTRAKKTTNRRASEAAQLPTDSVQQETSGVDLKSRLPMTWQTTEDIPRKHWWWFAIVGYVGIAGVALALELHAWSVAAVFIAAATGLIVTYARKPRTLTCILGKDSLTIDEKALDLNDYRAFTIAETLTGRNTPTRSLIVLLPKKRLGLALELSLTDDDQQNLVIAEAFQETMPFDEALSYQTTQRVLSRIAKWLRLS